MKKPKQYIDGTGMIALTNISIFMNGRLVPVHALLSLKKQHSSGNKMYYKLYLVELSRVHNPKEPRLGL